MMPQTSYNPVLPPQQPAGPQTNTQAHHREYKSTRPDKPYKQFNFDKLYEHFNYAQAHGTKNIGGFTVYDDESATPSIYSRPTANDGVSKLNSVLNTPRSKKERQSKNRGSVNLR
jgi:hypothetical protein